MQAPAPSTLAAAAREPDCFDIAEAARWDGLQRSPHTAGCIVPSSCTSSVPTTGDTAPPSPTAPSRRRATPDRRKCPTPDHRSSRPSPVTRRDGVRMHPDTSPSGPRQTPSGRNGTAHSPTGRSRPTCSPSRLRSSSSRSDRGPSHRLLRWDTRPARNRVLSARRRTRRDRRSRPSAGIRRLARGCARSDDRDWRSMCRSRPARHRCEPRRPTRPVRSRTPFARAMPVAARSGTPPAPRPRAR